MFVKFRISHWLVAATVLAALEGVAAVGLTLAVTAPAEAQWFGTTERRQRPQRSGGFFEGLFGPSQERSGPGGYYERAPSQPAENSYNAPATRKADKDALPPTTSIVVMGDSMADWLAYGLEDAFSDAPEIGVVRKHKHFSGLLRYDSKNDLDWWHVAKELLANEKPNFVIMMLGVNDRQNIRERDLAKEAEKKAKEKAKEKEEEKKTENAPAATTADQEKKEDEEAGSIIASEPPRGRAASGVIEFRSERWAQIYSRRIDETIAALKSKGVPVFWVGLPSIRGPKSTADIAYLNDLYRARAEKAGIVYIDVWDGFVDENGKFATFGPDFEGQNRRLRSGDGVFYTKAGARKLAHYVEREIRRYMSNRGPIALPWGPTGPMPSDGKPAVRPLAGPVVPLTTTPANADTLLGGAGGGSSAYGDALATQVLVKGETVYAPYGRADDFVWPRSETNRPAPPVTAVAPAAARANASAVLPPSTPQAIAAPEPTVAAPAPTPPPKTQTTRQPQRSEPANRTVQTTRPRTAEPRAEFRPPANIQRQPAPVRQPSRSPFDIFR